MMIDFRAFADEMTKIARARWTKELKSLGSGDVKALLSLAKGKTRDSRVSSWRPNIKAHIARTRPNPRVVASEAGMRAKREAQRTQPALKTNFREADVRRIEEAKKVAPSAPPSRRTEGLGLAYEDYPLGPIRRRTEGIKRRQSWGEES